MSNRLIQRHANISNMKSIKNNPLLNRAKNTIQQPPEKNNPNQIREAILHQRKVDQKIDSQKFNTMYDNIARSSDPDRERLWASRTNQPYKTIIPIQNDKKEYKSQDDLIVYKVKKEDKDKQLFENNIISKKKSLDIHNKELKDNFSQSKKEEHMKEFEYNHVSKYTIKYDPENHDDMKDNVLEYYKKKQAEQEQEKKCVDEIIDKMAETGLTQELNLNSENTSEVQNVKTKSPENPKPDKYAQRQKKI